ncbi:MAG: glycosyltransferase family 2 protein [Clostridia bacterium]|nr:glycosyltransferase family 2 protein [Clostridia bacterium]MBQ3482855.1 glycosyltransferase family 2 protein [Clostridia bacterium]
MSDKISIVVPCKNEEACIELFYDAFVGVISTLPVEYELIFVDDGSTDRTLEIFRTLARRDASVRYISLSRNFGKEGAIYAGLKAATGNLVGLMDVDLQDPPELLREMYHGIKKEGYDCVGCRRTTREGESRVRSFFARAFYKIINRMSDADIVDGARDYRLMSRRMTDAILSMSEVDRFSKGLFGWVGFRTKWLEYRNIDRVAGSTKWSFRKLSKYAIDGIEDFSTAPLKINFFLSLLCMLGALGVLAAHIVFAATDARFHEFMELSPIFIAVLFVGALILFGMGVLGEYIAKILHEAKHRPVYLVKETEDDLKKVDRETREDTLQYR